MPWFLVFIFSSFEAAIGVASKEGVAKKEGVATKKGVAKKEGVATKKGVAKKEGVAEKKVSPM